MKNSINIIKYYITALFLSLFITSCEDYLELQPFDGLSEKDIYSDESLTEAMLYEIYNYMPVGFGERESLGLSSGGNGWFHTFAEVTDESRNKSSWILAPKIFNTGLMGPGKSNLVFNCWPNNYRAIYRCNLMLKGLETSPYPEAVRKRYESEARFLRAVMYFNLARYYGNVPLIEEPQSPSDNLCVPQTEQQKVYDFAAKEMGECAENLPLAKDLADKEYGRATREAAWAFQGRIYLYMKEWAKSAEASLKVIKSESKFELCPDYGKLFQQSGKSPYKEVIFEIMFNMTNKYHGYESACTPGSYGGGSQFNPTQDLVDAYETTNGLSIKDDPTYDPKHPYSNRDKRLAATVVYHGMMYRGRVTDFRCTKTIKSDGKIEYKGLTNDAPLSGGMATITGYYVKKFNKEDVTQVTRYSDVSWIELRLGEVYLNYAEAINQAEGPQKAYEYLDLIRDRAGIKRLSVVRPSLTKDEMIEEILHERRVELAFENKRYWDLIRYDRAQKVLNGYVPRGMRAIVDSPDDMDVKEYEVYNVSGVGIPQVFPEQYKFMPIPQTEIDKNPLLKQAFEAYK